MIKSKQDNGNNRRGPGPAYTSYKGDEKSSEQ